MGRWQRVEVFENHREGKSWERQANAAADALVVCRKTFVENPFSLKSDWEMTEIGSESLRNISLVVHVSLILFKVYSLLWVVQQFQPVRVSTTGNIRRATARIAGWPGGRVQFLDARNAQKLVERDPVLQARCVSK